jgi:hypothetical protein
MITHLSRRLSVPDEAILLECAIYLRVFLQVLKRVGWPAESVGHGGVDRCRVERGSARKRRRESYFMSPLISHISYLDLSGVLGTTGNGNRSGIEYHAKTTTALHGAQLMTFARRHRRRWCRGYLTTRLAAKRLPGRPP